MSNLFDKWKESVITVYDSQEHSTLELLEDITNFNDEIAKGVDDLDFKIDTEINNIKLQKTDLYGDHKGSWQGLNRPTLSDEGMRATVEKINSDIPKIENDVTQIISHLEQKTDKTELEIERKRIDSFTKLTTGSTTGDAELIDGRVGADGKSYTNLGNAIRSQITQVKEHIISHVGKVPTNINILNLKDENLVRGYFNQVSGSYTQSAQGLTSGFIPIDLDNDTFIFPLEVDWFQQILTLWDSNKNMITSDKSIRNYCTIKNGIATLHIDRKDVNKYDTKFDNAKYIRIGFYKDNSNFTGYMITKNTQYPTSFIPFQEETFTYSDEFNKNIVDTVCTSTEVENLIKSLTHQIIDNPCDYNGNEICMLGKGVCIGDSLVVGTFDYKDINATQQYFPNTLLSWVSNLSRITGLQLTNKGDAGKTTTAWYNAHKDDDLSGNRFAIIALGINDAYFNNGWDIKSDTGITNIVNKLRAENNNIKIFIATLPPIFPEVSTLYKSVNDGIKAIASSLGLYLVDFSKYSKVSDVSTYAVTGYAHLNAYGYYTLGVEYKNYISYIIKNNLDTFKNNQFVGTNYAW